MTTFSPYVEAVTWDQVAPAFKKIEPAFYQAIEALSPGEDLPLVKVRYPFGATIIDANSTLNLPVSANVDCPLTDPDTPKQLREWLGYQSVPLGANLNKSVEVYREIDQRIFSLALFQPSLEIGVYELFSPATSFALSAGARSLLMLPKVTDTLSHKNLKRQFNIRTSSPKRMSEQWQVFTELANHPEFTAPWHCDIVFFTRPWIAKLKDPAWQGFHNLLLQRAWRQSTYARDKTIFEFNWKQFCNLLIEHGIRANPYLIHTLRHLIFMGMGILPGMAPANSDAHAPVSGLQTIYSDVYKLKYYIPTMMVPTYFSPVEKSRPIYYSLQYPTLIDSIPVYRNHVSAADDLRELQDLTSSFAQMVHAGELKLESNLIQKLFEKADFTFFHSDMYTYGGISPSHRIPEEDPAMLQVPKHILDDEKKFCDRSSFVRGCIRIASKP